MKVRRSLLKDLVAVETYQGESALGPVYAEAQSVRVFVDVTRRMVRDSSGVEVVSEATLIVHPDDEAKFSPESKVILGSRASSVISVQPQSFRGKTALVKVFCS